MDGRRQEARARFPFHILANPIPIIQHPWREHRDHIQIPHAVRGRKQPRPCPAQLKSCFSTQSREQ